MMETLLMFSATFRNQSVRLDVGNYDVMVLLEDKLEDSQKTPNWYNSSSGEHECLHQL